MDQQTREELPQSTDKFCTRCGKKLGFTEPLVDRYDGDTGQPVYTISLECPARSFFRPLHDEIQCELRPDGELYFYGSLNSELLDHDQQIALTSGAGG